MKISLNSRLKLILAILLIVVLPVFIWAVATQRIELRKRAATSEPPIVCWNRIQFQGGSVTDVAQLYWPDGCRGIPPSSQTACTQMPVPLSSTEVYQYQQWINAGRPYIPGCGYSPSPSPQPECGTCNDNTNCNPGLICQSAPTPTPNCPYGPTGPCSIPMIGFQKTCVKPDGTSQCGSTGCTPLPACAYNTDRTDIAFCKIAATPPNGGTWCPRPPTTCVQTGQMCGGFRGVPCPTGTSCVYGNGTNRAIYPDESGTCQIPLVKTVSSCGGISGQTCPTGTRCVYEFGQTRAPFPDASGSCQPINVPVACPTGGVYPTPTPTSCQGPNGSACTISSCPVCTSQICPMYACRLQQGTCQNNTCVPNPIPTPTPQGWCPGPNGTTCQTTISSVPFKCTTRPGVACPTSIQLVTGICQNNVCIAPTPTPQPPPGCYYTTACTNSIPPTCKTSLYCPPTPACVRNAPKVSISPANQSGNPGAPLLYIANITNTDTNCPATPFTLTNQVPNGFTGYFAQNTVTIDSGGSLGISYVVTSPTTNPNASSQTVPISFTAKNSASSLSSTANASYTFVQPTPVTVKFRFKFDGVTGNNAGAIKEIVKVTFAPRNGTAYDLKPDLILSFAGDGVYEANYTIADPLPPDTEFTMLVKGPKHGAIRFCQQTGQTAPCTYGQFMRATGLTFDFTGRPLPAGDLNQDNTIDPKDIKLVTDLLSKPTSQQTEADIKLADVNYDTYVDNTDLSLIVRSLSNRQDE